MSSSSPSGIQSLKEFIKSVEAAEPRQMLRAMGDVAASHDAMGEFQAHVLRHYEGVEAAHSFMDENGSIFDCVPVELQPSLRALGEALAKPPEPPAARGGSRSDDRRTERVAPLREDREDAHGNRMAAPIGTIPLRRLE